MTGWTIDRRGFLRIAGVAGLAGGAGGAGLLIPGGTAHAQLLWTEIGNFTAAGCKPTTASLIKVYPPNRKTAASGFFSLQGCRSTKAIYTYLHVTTVQPGVGHAL